jgi:hypothetical protein
MEIFENRRYMILDYSEINSVDFNQVLQKNKDELRLSLDGSKTVVKWDGETPSSVDSLLTKDGPYTHQEILLIMVSDEWTDNTDTPRIR